MTSKGSLDEIDFIKGIAMILVLLLHSFPAKILGNNYVFNLFLAQAVPLFILVTGFLFCYTSFDKKISLPRLSGKILKQIILPFFVFLIIIYAFSCLGSNQPTSREIMLLLEFGPGSYYPVIYIQVIIALVFVHRFVAKTDNNIAALITCLAACISIEIISGLVFRFEDGAYIYRLLAARYLFVVILGYTSCKIVKEGTLVNSRKTMTFGIVFLLSAFYSIAPIPIVTLGGLIPLGWGASQHSLSAFYTLFCALVLFRIYRYVPKFVQFAVKQIGKSSYYIFLFQMLFFAVFAKYIRFEFLGKYPSTIVYIIVSIIINVLAGWFLYRIINSRSKQRNHTSSLEKL